ncbi:MAG: aminotransferase class I/II-fold pyridoxal phosphate-dependent enzyme [Acidobacteria bacterium]|nr:MAG: aminotransferase class I/II-fold pyridoxal phosphate-dependent enzyme [Acidobacteriota bacterium]
MPPTFTRFSASIQPEGAFTVLAIARQLIAAGKEVIELEIGDSPFATPDGAVEAGIQAIRDGRTRYGPSVGLPEFRAAAAAYLNEEHGLAVTADHVVAGPGAKTFEQLFCEVFLEPDDGVLVFSPYFPTYAANIARRGARMVLSSLRASHAFRPDLDDVRRFLDEDARPKAVFLNSPHNPTGGVATKDDLRELADLIRGRDVAVFSDEPYDCMVWDGRHRSLLSEPGMLEQTVAAYTFSKSFSMSGWRLGYAVSSPETVKVLDVLTNTALSCVPPFTQVAGIAAMRHDRQYRDDRMQDFHRKVELLVTGLNTVAGVDCLMPGGTFYVFPSVAPICNRYRITSHGLAMYLLEGADDRLGVACLGGECFGVAGAGFLRLSCAQPDDRLTAAVAFIAEATTRDDRIAAYLAVHPEHRLDTSYEAPAIATA